MPGFNYGGYGDGTNWSSERGSVPPGGGASGNSGNRGSSSNSSTGSNSMQRQINTIKKTPAIRQKLADMIQAARKINPYAKLTIQDVSKKGVMSISVTELNADQAKAIGLSGLIMGLDASGVKLAIGDFATGVYRSTTDPSGHHSTPLLR
jgi:hypothetical protein